MTINRSHLENALDYIYKKSPLQRKRLTKYLDKKGEKYKDEAEEFLANYVGFLEKQNLPVEYAIDSYIKMCEDFLKCQIYFARTGKYPVEEDINSAIANVYDNPVEMQSYMIGLALSQYLWPTHFEMYNFFREQIKEYVKNTQSYLEIGPGHGLFLKSAIETFTYCEKFFAVDISETSLNISKSIMRHFFPSKDNIEMVNMDMLKLSIDNKFDFITMGEVLEHVVEPHKLLLKYRNLMSDNGFGFISTCANAPAIDHVYYFKTPNEMQDILKECGLKIIKDAILPVEDLPMEEILKKKITINYCALVKKD